MRFRRAGLWVIGLVLAAAVVASVTYRDDPEKPGPWRVWGCVTQLAPLPGGSIEMPHAFAAVPDGAPVLTEWALRRTRTPRRPVWRCAGLVLSDPRHRDRTILDRVLGRRPGWVASYAPSGVERAGGQASWREYVRTFEEEEPWRALPHPDVVGTWTVTRGDASPQRVELLADGSSVGLGDDAEWGSRDGVIVFRVPDARARTGVRYDTIAEHAGAWTGWSDDGVPIEMKRAAEPR